jgi:hypothetical protein
MDTLSNKEIIGIGFILAAFGFVGGMAFVGSFWMAVFLAMAGFFAGIVFGVKISGAKK